VYKYRLRYVGDILKTVKQTEWTSPGEQAERSAILCVLLEELEIYEIMLERHLKECSGKSIKYNDLKNERDIRSQIAARESMIRILALKNTQYVV
jgi:hypothetical protein